MKTEQEIRDRYNHYVWMAEEHRKAAMRRLDDDGIDAADYSVRLARGAQEKAAILAWVLEIGSG